MRIFSRIIAFWRVLAAVLNPPIIKMHDLSLFEIGYVLKKNRQNAMVNLNSAENARFMLLLWFFHDMNVWLAECFIYEFEIFLFSYW